MGLDQRGGGLRLHSSIHKNLLPEGNGGWSLALKRAGRRLVPFHFGPHLPKLLATLRHAPIRETDPVFADTVLPGEGVGPSTVGCLAEFARKPEWLDGAGRRASCWI
jgi:hypothetical protein